jgi:phosphoribosylformylglycinamidine synthase
VTVAGEDASRLTELALRHGVPAVHLGETGGASLGIQDQFAIPLDELREAWTTTLPAAFG